VKIKKRSPIKEAPLPQAGESLRERRTRVFEERIETPLFVAAGALIIAILEWWRVYFPSPQFPWLMTVMAVGAIGFLLWRVQKTLPIIRQLKLAEEGERKVGQELEQLRELGYEVFHDVPGPSFNVDHVLVGPAGLLCVETKTWRKPVDRDAKIRFDGEVVTVVPSGWRPARDPVAQSRALANWLQGLIRQSAGRELYVRPVVLLPGWWVEQGKGTTREIWVLEPKALKTFLGNEARRLAEEDIKLASFHLTQYVRAARREAEE
jgi:hypothetical protein